MFMNLHGVQGLRLVDNFSSENSGCSGPSLDPAHSGNFSALGCP